jgi:Xaa-Pro dipeptidase
MVSMKLRLARLFSKSKVKQVLIVNTAKEDPNFLYLTGFPTGWFEGAVLLARKESMTLFVNPLVYGMAKKAKPKEMKVVLLDRSGMLRDRLKKELKGKKVGINGSFLPYNAYKTLRSKVKAKLVDVSGQMEQARLIKDEVELRDIRKAVAVTKKAISAGIASLKIGITERQVATAIDMKMLELNSATAFDSIVAFDSNSALPHYAPGNRKLNHNSIVLLDIGAKYNNYCGDMTRTLMFKPDRKSKKYRKFTEIYNTVLRAQSLGLKKIKEGMPASASHVAAEKYINEYKGGIYKGKFIHSLGHSIGVEVHDGGAGLYPGCKTKLKRNMVFSDEPGIYLEGFGGVRIEDDVIVGSMSSAFI